LISWEGVFLPQQPQHDDRKPRKKRWHPLRGLQGFYQGFAQEWRRGRAESFLKDVLSVARQAPGGAEMLNFATENDIAIRIVDRKSLPGFAAATFSWSDEEGRFVVSLAQSSVHGRNAGFSALNLLHELRHAQQQKDWTGYRHAGDALFAHPRRAYLNLLMMEADAFTFQTVMALRLKAAGHPEHLENFIDSRTPEAQTIKRFLARKPFESYTGEAGFARALFAHLLTAGMHGYRTRYLHALAAGMGQPLHAVGPPPERAPSAALGALYGGDFAALVSLPALRAAAERALSRPERSLLKVLDRAAHGGRWTEAQAEAATGTLRNLEADSAPGNFAAEAFAQMAGAKTPATLSAFNAAAKALAAYPVVPMRVMICRPQGGPGGKTFGREP
jgi:hypothetical protein